MNLENLYNVIFVGGARVVIIVQIVIHAKTVKSVVNA